MRIRGSLFFRDEERALKPVFGRLAELNILPELEPAAATPHTKNEVVERVIRRAEEMRATWNPVENTAEKDFFGKVIN